MIRLLFVASTILSICSCCKSNLRLNTFVDNHDWKIIAIMPADGKYGATANRKLTYEQSGLISYKTILPGYLMGDLTIETRKRKMKKSNIALNTLIAKRYNADAFIETDISASGPGASKSVVVVIKVIDVKNNQVFAMTQKEDQSYWNDESVVEELLDSAIEEIYSALL